MLLYAAPDTVNKAIEDMKEWEGRKEESVEVKKSTSNRQVFNWKPPMQGWIKCNTDGSWSKEHQNQGISWISRDSTSRLLWAGAQRYRGMGSPIETEATALKWAMQTMLRLGYTQVIFETDFMVLARMIAGREPIWPKLYPIIQEISHLLSPGRSYRVEYYSRDGNKSADRIANEALSFMNYVPKLYYLVPSWLKQIFEVDVPMLGVNNDVSPNPFG